MIGLILSSRRKEFFEFATENAVLYDEVLDVEDSEKLNSFDAVFSDTELTIPGVSVEFIPPDKSFMNALATYVIGSAKPIVKDRSLLEWHFDKYYKSLAGFDVKFELEPVELLAEQEKVRSGAPTMIQALGILRKPDFPIAEPIQLSEDDLHEVYSNPNEMGLQSIVQQPQQSRAIAKEPAIYKQDMQQNVQYITQKDQVGMPIEPVFISPHLTALEQVEYERQKTTQQPASYGYEQQVPPSLFNQPTLQQPRFNQPVPQQFRHNQPTVSQGYTQPAAPTQLFNQEPTQQNTYQPAPRGFGAMSTRAVNTEGMIRARNSLAAKKRMYQVPIFTFSSLTPKAGVSTLAFSLAASLAIQQPMLKVLYLDLNVSNPNFIANYMNINPNTDACVKTVMGLSESEFMQNITLLTETVMVSGASFSVITMGQLSFQERKMLADSNYAFFLETISNSFDIIIVDCGELQSTLPYQAYMLSSHVAKHFILADGSDNRYVSTFIRAAQQITCNFEIVVNKNIPQAGAFAISQRLRQMPIATVGFHRNINHYLSGQLPMQDTALFNELCELGGKL